MLKANSSGCSNYFNYMDDGGKIASCCPAMDRKLLTLPGVENTYTFLINTWNTLPESYKQMVYENTLATVKHQIQQAENSMHAVIICMEAVHWQCYPSWLCELQSGARGAWNQKHWQKHSDIDQLYWWWSAFWDAMEQRRLQRSQWKKWTTQCHAHHHSAKTGRDGSLEVRSGNQWSRWVWGQWGRRSRCWCTVRSITSRWQINTEFRGLRA